MKQQFLEVGKITNVHGLMGEVRVQPWADSPDFLCKFKTLYVDSSHWPNTRSMWTRPTGPSGWNGPGSTRIW